MNCKHKFQVAGYSAVPALSKLRKKNWPIIIFRCKVCHTTKERPMTLVEVKKYRAKQVVTEKHIAKLHRVWWGFQKKFTNDEKWKYTGYDFMQRVERYAKTHPEIKVTGCDDDYHTCSDIVLIPHKGDGEYWGTTVVIIPQQSNNPVSFFLYPNHKKELISVLRGLK